MKMFNTLFLCVDQMRGDALGSYNIHPVQTPVLDELAKEGVCFRHAYSAAAPCGPARTSLLSGQYPTTHGSITNDKPFLSGLSLPSVVREAGITPWLYGFTDTVVPPYIRGCEGIMPGFEVKEYMNLHPEGLAGWKRWLESKGIDCPANVFDLYKPSPRYGALYSDTAFICERMIDDITALEQTDKPWFMHGAWIRPHPPFFAPDTYLPADEDVKLSENYPDIEKLWEQDIYQTLFRQGHRLPDSSPRPSINALTKKLQDNYRHYLGLISEVDHAVGKILAALKQTGQYDNTLIVFTSDHGEMMGERWLMDKGGWFDSAYHVPLIIKLPACVEHHSPGRLCDELISGVDIFPTILDLMNIDIPAACDGRSFKSLLTGETLSLHRSTVRFEHTIKHRGELLRLVTERSKQFKHVSYSNGVNDYFRSPVLFERDGTEQFELLSPFVFS